MNYIPWDTYQAFAYQTKLWKLTCQKCSLKLICNFLDLAPSCIVDIFLLRCNILLNWFTNYKNTCENVIKKAKYWFPTQPNLIKISDFSLKWNTRCFFYKSRFFFNLASVLVNFFMNWASDVAEVLLHIMIIILRRLYIYYK